MSNPHRPFSADPVETPLESDTPADCSLSEASLGNPQATPSAPLEAQQSVHSCLPQHTSLTASSLTILGSEGMVDAVRPSAGGEASPASKRPEVAGPSEHSPNSAVEGLSVNCNAEGASPLGAAKQDNCPQDNCPQGHRRQARRNPQSARSNGEADRGDLDRQIRQRAQQLHRLGSPVSFSERSSLQDVRPAAATPRAETAGLPLKALQRLNDEEFREQLIAEGIEYESELSRRELLLRVIRHRIKAKGLMYGEGTLQILPDGFGFLRSTSAHYISSADDIYVSPSQIRKFNLRTGCTVCGQVRPPKENERFFALLRVELVNGRTPDEHCRSKAFEALTPLHPDQRIVMEHDPAELPTRVIDLLAPIGFGQRGLIASPPRAGKTVLLQQMARAVLKNYPACYVIMLLIDERPEEVTDMVREIRAERCEVISSTFDESPARHIHVADMVLEKCKCLVETGTDVVLFLDSITRLARAWNSECPPSGRLLSGGLDANALQKPKSFFGAARKLEEGGSLTIVATALIETGSQLDEVIFEEFKGTGNLEIVLDRTLVERRIWPAINLADSGTRREERLLDEAELTQVCTLRKELSSLSPPDALEQLLEKLRKTTSNAEFLLRHQARQF